jgi:dihydrofolate reductase
MSSLQYFVASSLDGFIATPDDDLAWLLQFDGFEGGKESYESFFSGVGSVVMGGGTYSWLMEHEPDNWPYPSMPSWVFTNHELPAPANADITFVRGHVREFVQDFKDAAGGKNVWVVGGGNLAAQFADAGLLDELIVSVIPVVLGKGKPLLPLDGPTPPLELRASRAMGRGIVELRYGLAGAGAGGAGAGR